jgi:hypothetical protein
VIAESPNGGKAIGKVLIDKLVHKECLLLEERQIIMKHLKWSLERIEVRADRIYSRLTSH